MRATPQVLPRWMRQHNWLIGGILLLLSAVAIVLAAGWYARQERIAQLEAPLRGRSSGNAEAIARKLEDLRRDVVFLSTVPPIGGIARANANGGFDAQENSSLAFWHKRLKTIFSAYLVAHPDIVQARLIGIANNGRELIRVEREGQQVVVTPDEQLQEKGATEYMRAAASLGPGQTYISDFNLNREHGAVQLPRVPVVRAAVPVFGVDGKVFAVVVINYRIQELLRSVSTNLPSYLTAYLINGQGDFLLHPQPRLAFGFDLGARWRWQDEFQPMSGPAMPDSMQRYRTQGTEVYAMQQHVVLDPLRRERDLRYVLVNSSEPMAKAGASAELTAALTLLSGLALVAAAFYLYLYQRRQVTEREQRMSAIVDNSADAIIGVNLDGLVTTWNHGAELMFGYTEAEACGRKLSELILPAGMEQEAADILQRVRRGERISHFNTTRRRKDGGLVPVSVSSSPIKAADGRIIGLAKTLRDVSAQVAASQRIQEMNATLEAQVRARTQQIESVTVLQRAILAHASYAIIATDPDGVIRMFNPAAERMLGYEAAELVGRHTPAIWHDAAEVAARAQVLAAELGEPLEPGFEVFVAKARHDQADESEWTFIRKDGSRFPVLLSISALRAESGELTGFLGIASDISLRAQDRRTLLAARDQLLTASKVAELGIWSWQLDDKRIEWNQRMFELYDLPSSEPEHAVSLQQWRMRIHPDDADRVEAALHDAAAGRNIYIQQFRVCHRDGSIHYLQAAASIERDGEGRAVRVLGINRDITLQHEGEEALRLAKLAADDANRAKSEFLANMSHEIRSPMNAVLGMLALLQQTALDLRQRDYARKAEAAGRALLGIINDILDFSRVEAGKLALDPQPFSIDHLLRELGDILAANVGDKPVEILFQVEPGLPDWVIGDAMRLQQILINLAGNAVKFTAQGEVVLAVSQMAGTDPGLLRLAFSIRDTGIGISPEQRERIFEGFAQAEASTARRFGGSGLGLAICKRLVRLMDGAMTVESTVGQGSTFSFYIQCRRAEGLPERSPQHGPGLRQLRCLVIDDHAAARASIVAMLESFGWQVDAASSGEQGLAMFERQAAASYSAVFIDWQMPGMDGWDTAARIRQLPRAAQASIIVLVSARGRQVITERQANSPVLIDGIVSKPVTASALFDAVASANGAVLCESAAVPRASRLAGVRLLLVEDNPVNLQVARELLQSEGAQVVTAGDGLEALNMLRQQERFDCVLMDVQMPNMDGYTAARKIREELKLRTLPVIAMTANAMSGDRALALQAGMDDHIGKPFELDQVVAAILQHGLQRQPMAAAPAAASSVAALKWPAFDGDSALLRMGGQKSVYRAALACFEADAGPAVAAIIGMAHGPDSAAIAAALHSLRGMAATIGAEHLAQVARSIEYGVHGMPAVEWRQACAQLSAACAVALQHAADAGRLLEGAAPAAVAHPAPEPARLAPALRALLAKLEASSTDALPLFDALLAEYGGLMPGRFTELQRAIGQFDFAVAAQQCADILQELPASSTGTNAHVGT